MLTLLSPALAFCGFYVGGADAQLYNDATLVALMRDGDRTVLSMQNTYSGPPEDFALVVPVPHVLQKADVKTLPSDVFAKLDRLAAPRLVEYWERDPCNLRSADEFEMMKSARPPGVRYGAVAGSGHGVTIEAQFKVAEYDIVILSARDSGGLETWLTEEKYNIPDGASTALAPYVASGTKFFVAKVDPKRVTFQDDRAVLSPLRVTYQSKDFALPIRLGLLNSKGEQDLLIHLLGKNQRYQVANYDNVTIPTNLQVADEVRDDFGSFYEALFRNTVADHPNAVVTEYSWQSGSCDPCPGPTLSSNDIATLGGDLFEEKNPMTWTLTRLHYRYGPDAADEDLVFEAAPGIVGGRGTPDRKGRFIETVRRDGNNQFQGRYAILHRWAGPIACDKPQRGVWGGPNGRDNARTQGSGNSLAPRKTASVDLEKVIRSEWEGVKKPQPNPSSNDGSMIPEVK